MWFKKLKTAFSMLLVFALIGGLGVGAAMRAREPAIEPGKVKSAEPQESFRGAKGDTPKSPFAPRKDKAEVAAPKHPPLVKEPAYQSNDPKYGLLAFGPDAKARIWVVFDSVPDPLRPGDSKDLIYVDLNGNGDLTDPGERIEAFVDKRQIHISIAGLKHPQYEPFLEFTTPEFGGTDGLPRYQGLRVNVQWFRGKDRPCLVSLKSGERWTRYGSGSGDIFASKPHDAPIIRVDPLPMKEEPIRKAKEPARPLEQADTKSTPQWEYKALGQSEIASIDYKKLGYEVGLERGLNELGKQGWELVAFQPPMLDPVTRMERPALYVFKRMKK